MCIHHYILSLCIELKAQPPLRDAVFVRASLYLFWWPLLLTSSTDFIPYLTWTPRLLSFTSPLCKSYEPNCSLCSKSKVLLTACVCLFVCLLLPITVPIRWGRLFFLPFAVCFMTYIDVTIRCIGLFISENKVGFIKLR